MILDVFSFLAPRNPKSFGGSGDWTTSRLGFPILCKRGARGVPRDGNSAGGRSSAGRARNLDLCNLPFLPVRRFSVQASPLVLLLSLRYFSVGMQGGAGGQQFLQCKQGAAAIARTLSYLPHHPHPTIPSHHPQRDAAPRAG